MRALARRLCSFCFPPLGHCETARRLGGALASAGASEGPASVNSTGGLRISGARTSGLRPRADPFRSVFRPNKWASNPLSRPAAADAKSLPSSRMDARRRRRPPMRENHSARFRRPVCTQCSWAAPEWVGGGEVALVELRASRAACVCKCFFSRSLKLGAFWILVSGARRFHAVRETRSRVKSEPGVGAASRVGLEFQARESRAAAE